MTFLKNLQKNIKAHHFVALIGVLVLAFAIMQYSGRKTIFNDGFGDGYSNSPSNTQGSAGVGGSEFVSGAQPLGQNEVFSNRLDYFYRRLSPCSPREWQLWPLGVVAQGCQQPMGATQPRRQRRL